MPRPSFTMRKGPMVDDWRGKGEAVDEVARRVNHSASRCNILTVGGWRGGKMTSVLREDGELGCSDQETRPSVLLYQRVMGT